MVATNISTSGTNTDEQLVELKASIVTLLLPFLLIIISASVILMNILSGPPRTSALVLWLVMSCIWIASFILRSRSLHAAIYLFLIGTMIVALAGAYEVQRVDLLNIFPFVIMLSLYLLSGTEAFGMMIFALLMIFGLSVVIGLPAHALLPAGLVIVAFIVGAISVYRIRQVISMLETYQQHILKQMDEARKARGVLAQRTKALEEATENLRHLNSKLALARQAAEEAHRLKAQFAANVSHELRTPINLIVGFTELIVTSPDTYGAPLPAAYWTDVNTIYRNARHLQSLINDVLDVSQIEANHMAIVKEKINIAAVIEEVADMLRDQIQRKGLTFKIDLEKTLPSLWLDRVRIRQVLINLLGNALRFTDQGSISLSAFTDQDSVRICICDTGIGISAHDIHRIFEEFHQVDASLSRRNGGSGLGLTISKRFVEMHHGRLYATSEGIPGKGSTFTIELPLSERGMQWATTHTTSPVPHNKEERSVVLLDNDPNVVQLFQRYTTKHKVLSPPDWGQALSWIQPLQPSAIIIDNELSASLEEEDIMALRGICPLITCPMPSGRRMMQKLGVTNYLVKPVTAEALAQAVREVGEDVRSILVVDDDRDMVRLLSRMLQGGNPNYLIRKAYGGEEGLALMRSQTPDVVVLDLLMPNVDGMAVVQHMKGCDDLRDIPVVMVSARGASDAITPLSTGTLSVSKPGGFEALELVHMLEALIETLNPTSLTESRAALAVQEAS